MRTNLVFAACVVVFLAADLWSKSYVKTHCGRAAHRIDVIPGCYSIRFSENPGGVFGIGQGRTHWFIAFTLLALGVLAWLFLTADRSHTHVNVGIALITSGALGNLYDRILNGAVRDFIDWYIGSYHWYTFNIADACICVGVAFLMLDALLGRPEPQRDEAASA